MRDREIFITSGTASAAPLAFQHAVTALREWRAGRRISGGMRSVLAYERLVLDHKPTSWREADAIMEIVIDNVSTEPRDDGREVSALQAVWCFVRARA